MRTSTKRIVWLFLGLAVGVQASGVVAKPKRTSAKAKPVTLTVWVMPNGPDGTSQSFLDIIQPFTETNPTVSVEAVTVSWSDAFTRIEAAAEGRTAAPDIVQVGSTWVAAFATTGKLLDLTGKYDVGLFAPEVLATAGVADEPQLAGKQFALPWLVDTRALYYNKEYCKRAGINPEKDFDTWESFHQSLRKLKQLSPRTKPFAPLGVTLASWNIIHSLSWWIWGAGGGFVETAKSPGIASQGTLDGIEFYVGLAREGLLSREAEQLNQVQIAELLASGAIAATISMPISAIADDRFGIAPIPAGPRGRFTFLGGSALAVLASSRHPEEAISLLRFLSTDDAQMRYSIVTGVLLAAAGQYDELLLRLDPIRRAFVAQMRHGRAYPSIAQWGDIEVVLRDRLSSLWAKATSQAPYDRGEARRQLQEAQRQIDLILQRRKRPTRP